MYQVFFYFFMNTTQLTTIFKDGLRRRYAPRNDGVWETGLPGAAL